MWNPKCAHVTSGTLAVRAAPAARTGPLHHPVESARRVSGTKSAPRRRDRPGQPASHRVSASEFCRVFCSGIFKPVRSLPHSSNFLWHKIETWRRTASPRVSPAKISRRRPGLGRAGPGVPSRSRVFLRRTILLTRVEPFSSKERGQREDAENARDNGILSKKEQIHLVTS